MAGFSGIGDTRTGRDAGAGDTVIATLALALAAGATISEAARLANEAAGIVVARFGPATVGVAELLKALEVAR